MSRFVLCFLFCARLAISPVSRQSSSQNVRLPIVKNEKPHPLFLPTSATAGGKIPT